MGESAISASTPCAQHLTQPSGPSSLLQGRAFVPSPSPCHPALSEHAAPVLAPWSPACNPAVGPDPTNRSALPTASLLQSACPIPSVLHFQTRRACAPDMHCQPACDRPGAEGRFAREGRRRRVVQEQGSCVVVLQEQSHCHDCVFQAVFKLLLWRILSVLGQKPATAGAPRAAVGRRQTNANPQCVGDPPAASWQVQTPTLSP